MYNYKTITITILMRLIRVKHIYYKFWFKCEICFLIFGLNTSDHAYSLLLTL